MAQFLAHRKPSFHGSCYYFPLPSSLPSLLLPLIKGELTVLQLQVPDHTPLSFSCLPSAPEILQNPQLHTHMHPMPACYFPCGLLHFPLTQALVRQGQTGRAECKCYHFGSSSRGAEHRCLQGQAQPGKNGGIVCGLTQRPSGPTQLPASQASPLYALIY